MMTNDAELMLEFQQGSREAFAELFARYREPIYRFFRRRLAVAARAEDLVQETFLAVLRAAERYEPRAAFRSFLFGIAFKLLAAERRRARPGVERPLEEADPPAEAGPETALWVRRALEQLGPEHREVVMLREYEQLSYEEIAELLRVPANTVRSRLFRARMALKDLLLAERGSQRG